jgi:hypothetical protein
MRTNNLMVKRPAHNRLSLGSIPTRRTIFIKDSLHKSGKSRQHDRINAVEDARAAGLILLRAIDEAKLDLEAWIGNPPAN